MESKRYVAQGGGDGRLSGLATWPSDSTAFPLCVLQLQEKRERPSTPTDEAIAEVDAGGEEGGRRRSGLLLCLVV